MTLRIETKYPTIDERQEILRLAHQLRAEALADTLHAAGRALRWLVLSPRLLTRRTVQ